MRDSPHTPEGRTTRILFALVGTLLLLLLLSLAAQGVNPNCGHLVAGYKAKSCAGPR